MANFRDFEFMASPEFTELEVAGVKLAVRNYLPIDKKAEMINFIVNGALDETTGCFSPIRTEVYFGIAVCAFYAGVEFDLEDLALAGETYDALDLNGIIDAIIGVIPGEELDFIKDLVESTTADIARYNSSAAGIIRTMSNNAEGLDSLISTILEQIKNKEGLEMLSVIKDVVGTD